MLNPHNAVLSSLKKQGSTDTGYSMGEDGTLSDMSQSQNANVPQCHIRRPLAWSDSQRQTGECWVPVAGTAREGDFVFKGHRMSILEAAELWSRMVGRQTNGVNILNAAILFASKQQRW